MSAKPWERQEKESEQAFQAFLTYLNQGVERATRKVARQLSKSESLIMRWSAKWNWPHRIESHTDHLLSIATESRERETTRQAKKILTANEVKIGLSRIADSDIAEIFEPDGTFDLAAARARGVTRLIKSISFDKDTGRVTKIEAYSAHEGYRDMGKAHGIFPTTIKIAPEDADKLIDDAIAQHGLPALESASDAIN